MWSLSRIHDLMKTDRFFHLAIYLDLLAVYNRVLLNFKALLAEANHLLTQAFISFFIVTLTALF